MANRWRDTYVQIVMSRQRLIGDDGDIERGVNPKEDGDTESREKRRRRY